MLLEGTALQIKIYNNPTTFERIHTLIKQQVLGCYSSEIYMDKLNPSYQGNQSVFAYEKKINI